MELNNIEALSPTNSYTSLYEDKSFNSTEAPHKSSISQSLIIYVFIGTFGLIGNSSVFGIIMSSVSMRKTSVNKLILYQSFIDGSASLWMLITCDIRYDLVLQGTSGDLKCKLWLSKFIMWSLFLSSTFNLVVLTLERYFSIVHPLRHKRQLTSCRLYAMMIIPTMLAFVFMIAQTLPTSGLQNNYCLLLAIFPDTTTMRIYIMISSSIQLFIPLLIMFFSYGHIFIVLYLKSREGIMGSQDRRRAENLQNASRNVLKTMVTVCLLFFLCWVGNVGSFVLYAFGVIPPFFSSPWYHVSTYLCFINCTVNPIVYSLQYNEFQKAAKRLLCGKKHMNSNLSDTSSTSLHTISSMSNKEK